MIPDINKINHRTELPKWAKNRLFDPVTGGIQFAHFAGSGGEYDFYTSRDQWLRFQEWIEKEKLRDREGNIINHITIVPYLKVFSVGFSEGFTDFLLELTQSGVISNENIQTRKTIDIAESIVGFPYTTSPNVEYPYIERESWYKSGIETGLWYHAWYTIINNYEIFSTYFQAGKRPKHNYSNLLDIFESIPKYHYIMQLLVKAEYCEAGTYIWKDEKKGSKVLIASIIKDLHVKGYYKDDHKPTTKEIIEISKNTFKVSISEGTVKKAKHSIVDFNIKGRIPLASTIL